MSSVLPIKIGTQGLELIFIIRVYIKNNFLMYYCRPRGEL